MQQLVSYDAKEWDTYRKDTPCTYAVQFTVVDNKLNMCCCNAF